MGGYHIYIYTHTHVYMYTYIGVYKPRCLNLMYVSRRR